MIPNAPFAGLGLPAVGNTNAFQRRHRRSVAAARSLIYQIVEIGDDRAVAVTR